jgi:hypothetical protein
MPVFNGCSVCGYYRPAVCNPCLLTLEIPSNQTIFIPGRGKLCLKKQNNPLPQADQVWTCHSHLFDTQKTAVETSQQKSSFCFCQFTFFKLSLPFSAFTARTAHSVSYSELTVFKGGKGSGSSFKHICLLVRTHALYSEALFASGKN